LEIPIRGVSARSLTSWGVEYLVGIGGEDLGEFFGIDDGGAVDKEANI